MNIKEERRKNTSLSEEELYKIPNIQEFIEKERRHDELDKLNEVIQQKTTWRNTFICCLLLNLFFLSLGLYGLFFY